MTLPLGGMLLGEKGPRCQEGWPNSEEPLLMVGCTSTTTARGRASSTLLTLEAPVDKSCWRMRGRGAGETTTNGEMTINNETTIDN
jgi:hypothetical protein